MSKIATIKTGGKQYIVNAGDKLKIEKLPDVKDNKIVFDQVLMISDEKGKDLQIGAPFIKGAQVEAQVLEQGRDKKVRVTKYKNKTRYHKVYGHRQPFTKVQISKITN